MPTFLRSPLLSFRSVICSRIAAPISSLPLSFLFKLISTAVGRCLLKVLAFFSLFASPVFFYPTLAIAQSAAAANPAVVWVQELTLSAKAVKTFKKGTYASPQRRNASQIPYFRAVIDLAPGYYGTYHNISLAESRLDQLDDAAVNFQKSIDPTSGRFAPSLFGLAMILYRRSEFGQAESPIDRGLVAGPPRPLENMVSVSCSSRTANSLRLNAALSTRFTSNPPSPKPTSIWRKRTKAATIPTCSRRSSHLSQVILAR